MMDEINKYLTYILLGFSIVLIFSVRDINGELKELRADYDQLNERYEELEEVSSLDKDTAQALIEFYYEFQDAIEVYDGNVDLYKEAFRETDNRLSALEDAVVTIITALQRAGL